MVNTGDNFDPIVRAKTIAPFIDEETVAVIHIDLTRIEVDPLVDEIYRLVPDAFDMKEPAQVKLGMHKELDPMLQSGGKDIYIIYNSFDIKSPPLLVIPLYLGADEDAIKVCSHGHFIIQRIQNTLVVIEPRDLSRFSNLIPAPRPELAVAFNTAGDTTAQVVFIPPKHFKRVIEEVMPQLPGKFGGGPSSVITQGCLWAALGLDLPPLISMRLFIQSQDTAAATILGEKWNDFYSLVAGLPEVQEYFPNLAEVSAILTPRVEGNGLALILDDRDGTISTLIQSALPTIEKQRERARRKKSLTNLKYITLAMHNYHAAYKHFPAAASYSPDGKPLLSWRVWILPMLEQGVLYDQFHFDEPWDSEHNKKLIDKMPPEYRSPKSKLKEPGKTNYVVPVGPGTVFEGREGMPLQKITDGTVFTIMAVEVDDEHAVIWTKPDDLPYDPIEPSKGLGGLYKNGFCSAFCDGAAHWINLPCPDDSLRAWFNAAGGEIAPRP